MAVPRRHMVIEPQFIKNWCGMGLPPDVAFEQYAELWHIEFVLRHFVYASLRLTYGDNWRQAIERVRRNEKSLLEELSTRVTKAQKEGEFSQDNIPDVLWFTTTKELIEIITNKDNWEEYLKDHLGEYGVTRKSINKELAPLFGQRNRWAHFRPLRPGESRLDSIIGFLNKPLSKWYAHKYWNSNPVRKEHDIFGKYALKCPDGIPLTNDRHGITGFIDKTKKLDRGSSILLEINETSSCFWAKAYNVGGISAWSLDLITAMASKLRDRAIHIAVNFDPFTESDLFSKFGIEDVSVSFSVKSGVDNLVAGLEIISDTIHEHKMISRKPMTEEPIMRHCDVIKILFYEAPFNVMIAPTQEAKQWFRIVGGDERFQ